MGPPPDASSRTSVRHEQDADGERVHEHGDGRAHPCRGDDRTRSLQPNRDRLAIVAPASPFVRDEFDRGVEEIRSLGFEAVYDDTVFERHRYVAGSAQTRAAAIHAAFSASSCSTYAWSFSVIKISCP